MKIPRIVFDSNVVISGFLFGGLPAQLLKCAVEESIQVYISLPILDEIRDVLLRPKFGLSADQALSLIEELHDLCQIVTPSKRVRAIVADPDDNAILECAMEGEVDLIVSGDSHLLDLGKWKGIEILSPAEALKKIE